MYLVAHYLPTALFSLKHSQATNAAAKTLLVPSPYAVKMALLDAAIHWQGMEFTQTVFAWLSSMRIRVAPPEYTVVNNGFIKIQRPPKNPKPGQPFGPTIAFREYAHMQGMLKLAFDVSALNEAEHKTLNSLLLRINYFGKRGCFVQFIKVEKREALDSTFVYVPGDSHQASIGLTQYLDDFGDSMTWEMANTFDPKTPKRAPKAALLPYQMVRSTKRSTFYRRTDQAV